MKALWKKLRENALLLVLAGILCIYFGAICLINFSGRPSFYQTDMYTDMMFAAQAWEHKSLIPEGWLFGNQLYVVAAPAIAALYCGVAPDPQVAMAMAAVTLTVLVLVSFHWMLKSVLSKREDRLLCIVIFMTLSLFFGDSVGTENGWQLFFTMCAYYACYLVNVFFAFGIYLRADHRGGWRFWTGLAAVCVLSFCTGIQSLRQTAVMSLPLMAVALLRLLLDLRAGKNWKRRSLIAAGAIFLANILGLLYVKTIDFAQTEIFGELTMAKPQDILPAVGESIQTLLALMPRETGAAAAIMAAVLVLGGGAAAEMLWRERKQEESGALTLLVLLTLGVLVIGVIDVFTTIFVRQIYYFLFYPLAAFVLAYGFSHRKAVARAVLLGVMVLTFVMPSMIALKDICMQAYFQKYDSSYEVSDYLLENGYTTVYGLWNQADEIAIASDFQIQVGYWDEAIFTPVTYLCNPEVFEADSDECVYAFYGEIYIGLAQNRAAEKGIELTLLEYFPDSSTYLYTAPVNLMQAFAQ